MGRPKGSKNKTKTTGAPKSRSTGKVQDYDAPMMGDEAAIIITFAVSVFLFLSNLGLCGPIGAALKAIQLGMFGMIGYIFPIVLSFVVAFILSNIDNPHAALRMTAALFMLVFLSALLQLFASGGVQNMSLLDLYSEGAELGIGGGIVGGALAMLLYSLAGTVGAVLVLLVACFICLIYITGKPLARMLARHSADAAARARVKAREDLSQVAASARLHKEERRLAKEEEARHRKSSGVDMQAIDLFALQPKPEELGLSAEKAAPAEDAGSTDDIFDKIYQMPGVQAAGPAASVSSSEVMGTSEAGGIEAAAAGSEGRTRSAILGPDENAGNTVELPLNVRHAPADTSAAPANVTAAPSDQGMNASAAGSFGAQPDPQAEDALEQVLAKTWSAPAPSPEVQSAALFDDTNASAAGQTLDSSPSAASYDLPASYAAPEETELPEDGEDAYPAGSDFSDHTDLPAAESSGTAAEAYAGDGGVSVGSNGMATIGRGDMEQGTRRIVASNGQVIDADVEPIRKKIETQMDREKKENIPTEADNAKVQQEIIEKKKERKPYVIPPLSLLQKPAQQDMDTREEIRQNALTLQETLKSFGVNVTITNISVGPSVTRYELQPEIGVKVSKIVSLTNDIKMRLAASDIRIEAPIPGKSAVGIEVPNKHGATVYLGEVLGSTEFQSVKAKLAFGVGKDIAGKTIVTDIAKMPHLLIAGATGSGKSVCINTLIMSMLFKYKPEDVRMIMVDPKVVELSVYNGIPHLLIPVVTDPKKAAAALNWAVAEMTDRYKKFAESGSRDLKGYNEKIMAVRNDPEIPEDQKPEKLPQIVIIIDELADLMMVSSQEVEDAICRIAQLARAAGMHLVIATQRPTVDVITGLIKANVPSRIAFAVSSGTDSRTIIDMTGAEKLLGKGDMLFFPQGIPKPVRVQGAFVSDQEVSDVVDFIKKEMGEVEYSTAIQAQVQSGGSGEGGAGGSGSQDELFQEAGRLIIESEKASIGMLQRKFRIGFNRAARIMDQLADAGVVGPEEGTKPRRIIMSLAEFEELTSGG